MKFAFLQANANPYNFIDNCDKIGNFCDWARRNECDLAILPSETLFGISNKDIPGHLVAANLNHLADTIPQDLPLLTAYHEYGLKFVLINNGTILNLSEELFFNSRQFLLSSDSSSPANDCQLPSFQLCLKSTPWHLDKYPFYEENLVKIAKNYRKWIFSPSIFGGYGNQVFSGQSVFINPNGEIIQRGKAFLEDKLIIDTDINYKPLNVYQSGYNDLWQALILGTRDFLHKSNHFKGIIGLSGGMDSALVACVLKEALGSENVLAILMPSRFTSDASNEDALALAKNLEIVTWTLPIESIKNQFLEILTPVFLKLQKVSDNLAEENLQARIRGNILMALSNYTDALVINTGNKSEGLMGYCTLYGDTIGALAVIGDLYKTQVYELAEWYCANIKNNIPLNIFKKAPSAELRPNQKDEDSLPPYNELDPCLKWLQGESEVSCENYSRLDEIRARLRNNIFKHKLYPPALRVGNRNNIWR